MTFQSQVIKHIGKQVFISLLLVMLSSHFAFSQTAGGGNLGGTNNSGIQTNCPNLADPAGWGMMSSVPPPLGTDDGEPGYQDPSWNQAIGFYNVWVTHFYSFDNTLFEILDPKGQPSNCQYNVTLRGNKKWITDLYYNNDFVSQVFGYDYTQGGGGSGILVSGAQSVTKQLTAYLINNSTLYYQNGGIHGYIDLYGDSEITYANGDTVNKVGIFQGQIQYVFYRGDEQGICHVPLANVPKGFIGGDKTNCRLYMYAALFDANLNSNLLGNPISTVVPLNP